MGRIREGGKDTARQRRSKIQRQRAIKLNALVHGSLSNFHTFKGTITILSHLPCSSCLSFAVSCHIVSRQLTSLLLRWTNAPETSSNSSNSSSRSSTTNNSVRDDAKPCEPNGEDEPTLVHAEDGGAGKSEDRETETAMLVAAGLKLVRTVCTKAENNKGESCIDPSCSRPGLYAVGVGHHVPRMDGGVHYGQPSDALGREK